MVHLINRNGGGIHNKKHSRSFKKQELNKKIKQGELEDI